MSEDWEEPVYSYPVLGPCEGMVHTLIKRDKVRVTHRESRRIHTYSYWESVQRSKDIKYKEPHPQSQEDNTTLSSHKSI